MSTGRLLLGKGRVTSESGAAARRVILARLHWARRELSLALWWHPCAQAVLHQKINTHACLLEPTRLPPRLSIFLSIIYTVIALGRVVSGSGDITRSLARKHARASPFFYYAAVLPIAKPNPSLLLPLHYTDTRSRPRKATYPFSALSPGGPD